jgi:hypothetical protein
LVVPLLNSSKTLPPLHPSQALVFEKELESICESFDIPGCGRVAIDTILNEIGHTAYLARHDDGKSGAHSLVHGKSPRFVF